MSAYTFVMTSRVESFGMIDGEAMSHGCVCEKTVAVLAKTANNFNKGKSR